MNPWIIIGLIGAVIVFLVDLVFRRKTWKNNTKTERISLVVQMISIVFHLFLSGLGMLWGITGCGADTAFGVALYDVTIVMAFYYFIVAIVATLATLILRKIGKAKASIWVNVTALVYMIIVLTVNGFANAVL